MVEPLQNIPGQACTAFVPGVGEVYFNAQRYFLTISEELRSTFSFDIDGRLMSAFLGGVNYRRGLKSDILMKYFADRNAKTRRFLSLHENHKLVDDVLTRVLRIRDGVDSSMQADIVQWLDTILTWNVDRLQSEGTTFQNIYKPISILPPDQYLSVVLQAAEGCSWNQCTFCTFYRDRKFRIKSPHDFRQHAQQIKDFLGRSIGLRKSIFLADANALIIPQRRLVELLKVVHEEFPIETPQADADYTLKGIYSFLDIFGAEKKTLENYRELRELGLKRIYIGLETGDNELFKLLNKPGSPEECVEAVRTIKAAGINIGIIILAGAGGDRFYHQHVHQSLQAIGAMGLGIGDLVYISPLMLSGQDAYSCSMRDLGVRTLSPAEVTTQFATIKTGLKAIYPEGPKVALYHIEEFIY